MALLLPSPGRPHDSRGSMAHVTWCMEAHHLELLDQLDKHWFGMQQPNGCRRIVSAVPISGADTTSPAARRSQALGQLSLPSRRQRQVVAPSLAKGALAVSAAAPRRRSHHAAAGPLAPATPSLPSSVFSMSISHHDAPPVLWCAVRDSTSADAQPQAAEHNLSPSHQQQPDAAEQRSAALPQPAAKLSEQPPQLPAPTSTPTHYAQRHLTVPDLLMPQLARFMSQEHHPEHQHCGDVQPGSTFCDGSSGGGAPAGTKDTCHYASIGAALKARASGDQQGIRVVETSASPSVQFAAGDLFAGPCDAILSDHLLRMHSFPPEQRPQHLPLPCNSLSVLPILMGNPAASLQQSHTPQTPGSPASSPGMGLLFPIAAAAQSILSERKRSLQVDGTCDTLSPWVDGALASTSAPPLCSGQNAYPFDDENGDQEGGQCRILGLTAECSSCLVGKGCYTSEQPPLQGAKEEAKAQPQQSATRVSSAAGARPLAGAPAQSPAQPSSTTSAARGTTDRSCSFWRGLAAASAAIDGNVTRAPTGPRGAEVEHTYTWVSPLGDGFNISAEQTNA